MDFRKSAGGFIHGYRYTTRALHRLLEWKNHGVPWPHLPSQPYSQIVPWIIKRVNEASGPYQMFQILGDVLVFNELVKFILVINVKLKVIPSNLKYRKPQLNRKLHIFPFYCC